MHTDKAEGRETYGSSHVAHLTVLAFDEREFYPAGGNIGSVAHWRVAGPDPVGFFGDFCLAGFGVVSLDVHAFREL